MITVITKKPVAIDSLDHIKPCGTAQDNSVNPAFNAKLFEVIPRKRVRLLDIGCAGGGLVGSLLRDGAFAIGIEGSDYSKKRKRAEWGVFPGYLFTADATEPFEVTAGANNRQPARRLQFNVVTAWELFEHIAEDKIPAVCKNILSHLEYGGFFIGSIATEPHEDYHVTLHPKDWWIDTFTHNNLIWSPSTEEHFGQDVVRSFGFTIALRPR